MVGTALRQPVRGSCLGRAVLLAAVLALGWTLLLAARIEATGRRDDARRSDAIVVLGAAQWWGRPSPVFRARLDHALALYEQGSAPLVIVAGGGAEGDQFTEAEAGVGYLRRRGVPERALLAVPRGDSTLSSLEAVAAEAEERGLGSVILVTDRFHAHRSLQMAQDLGLAAHASPTTTSPVETRPASRLRYTLREVAALSAYMLSRS